jgi:hypothetical protein
VTDVFPPVTARQKEVTTLLEALRSVTEPRAAIYVSSPLTTGVRAFEWHRRHAVKDGQWPADRFLSDVIEPNREEAARFARELRGTTSKAVIDPTAVRELDGWTQSDYRFFWGRVIEEYCDEVVFRDGWQFSSGCSYEYLVGWQTGATLLREDMNPLTKREAEQLLAAAIVEVEARSTSAAFLRAVKGALSRRRKFARRT